MASITHYTFYDSLADPHTDPSLLPDFLVPRDNSRRLRYCKAALRKAFHSCLTPTQQEQLRLHYWEGLRKTEIARRQQRTCSAVSKSIKAGESALRAYMTSYMEMYVALERELLSELNVVELEEGQDG